MRDDGFIEINGQRYELVTLDFETYFDDEYSLSKKYNTSEYVRSSSFKAHGMGIKIGNGETLWYTGINILLRLKSIDWTKSALLCHNTPFDGFICSEQYGVHPAFNLDTLAMSRAVHGQSVLHNLDALAQRHGRPGKVKRAALADTKGKRSLTDKETRALGAYCLDDVDDTYECFWGMYEQVPDEELRLIDLTTKMFTDPVLLVDLPRVDAELKKEVGGKMAALLISGASTADLLSNNKFAELLKQAGAVPPLKISPATGRSTYAFAKDDPGFQALAQHPSDLVRRLQKARLAIKSTIGETRAARFLEAGRDGKCLPVLLNYYGAHTGRWSGGNKMNLQNLARGGELRKAILAPPGWAVVVADSAQIEARVLAWLAGQDDVIEAFAQGRDIYSEFATVVFNRPIDRKRPAKDEKGRFLDKEGNVVATYDEADKPDFLEGFIGKICVLALGYGMGPDKLQSTLKAGTMGPSVELSIGECRRLVAVYRSKNYKIKALWDQLDLVLLSMCGGTKGTLGPLEYGKGFVQLPNGLFLHYPGLHGTQVGMRSYTNTEFKFLGRRSFNKIYGGLFSENVVQALARCVIAEQMLKVVDKGYRVVSMTHDEIIAIAPIKKADKCLSDMIAIMSTPPEWAPGLPLAAEGGWDTNYGK